ncbi:MAG: class I SAM-dependent methyltransferase [Myxococcaceae bacterium]
MISGRFKRLLKRSSLLVRLNAKLDWQLHLAKDWWGTRVWTRTSNVVVSFEPQPRNVHCLFQNLVANGWEDRAEVFPAALGARPGLLPLYGASGPSASLLRNWAGYSARYKRTVPVTRSECDSGTFNYSFVGEQSLPPPALA